MSDEHAGLNLHEIASWSKAEANQSVTFKTIASTTGPTCTTRRSIGRATKKTLALHQANFSLDGLRFHCGKLKQYTNPTGGALDKIPLNDKAHTALFYAQWNELDAPTTPPDCEPAHSYEPVKQRPLFLAKKAQYHVADHLLGTGKKAYWTGSTGKSTTLLGLDIDDHESPNEADVQANSEEALQLFVELTGFNPIPCKSPRGINAFLICNKWPLTTHQTNELWHSTIRSVNAEANRRGLVANLECKGKARIFNKDRQYCGVQFKDPLYATNPSNDQLHAFWQKLEDSPVSGTQLHDLLSMLANEKYCAEIVSPEKLEPKLSVSSPVINKDTILPVYGGYWTTQCQQWAIHGLPCDDSMTQVVWELAKWLYFVELGDLDEGDRVRHVVQLLATFCFQKHNGFITRIIRGQNDDLESHVERIVKAAITRLSPSGRAILSQLQSRPHVKLVPLMQNEYSSSLSSSSSPVKTECCTVSAKEWLPAPEYRRQRAEKWVYVPNDSSLPEALTQAITRFYDKQGLKMKKPTKVKILRFINHLWGSPEHEARLGVESLKKMGFSNHAARQHIKHLEDMGVIQTEGYCPAAGVSKLYRLRQPVIEMFLESSDS